MAAPRHSRWLTLTWRQTRSVWRGRVVALAGAAVGGLLLDPLAQRDDLGAERALGHLDERALVVGHALAHAVQAGVVGPPLEYGERAAALEPVTGRLEQGRDVALDELVLQRERRRGHHDPVLVQQRGHEVAERLAGAGAGLDEQVLLVLHRRGDRLGHRDLAGTLLAAELLDGSTEHLAHAACSTTRAPYVAAPTPHRPRPEAVDG